MGNGVTDAALLALLDTAGTKVGDTGGNVAKGVPDTVLGLGDTGKGATSVGAALDIKADAAEDADGLGSAVAEDADGLGSAVAEDADGLGSAVAEELAVRGGRLGAGLAVGGRTEGA
jgi:hypothetical protein